MDLLVWKPLCCSVRYTIHSQVLSQSKCWRALLNLFYKSRIGSTKWFSCSSMHSRLRKSLSLSTLRGTATPNPSLKAWIHSPFVKAFSKGLVRIRTGEIVFSLLMWVLYKEYRHSGILETTKVQRFRQMDCLGHLSCRQSEAAKLCSLQSI